MRQLATKKRHLAGDWRRRARPGAITVEFTLVMLFAFLPMTFGMLELGRAAWHYNQLSHLSREAARWLTVTHHDPANSTFTQTGNSPSADITYTNVTSCCAASTAVGWIGQMDVGIPLNDITVRVRRSDSLTGTTWTSLTYVHGRSVLVRVNYTYRPIVSGFLGLPTTIPMQATTVMQMQ